VKATKFIGQVKPRFEQLQRADAILAQKTGEADLASAIILNKPLAKEQDAARLFVDAQVQAEKTVAGAWLTAKQISGDGYDVMRNRREWEKVAKAMSNRIDGYGDEYIKPSGSLLDDLAKEFGHKEAGQKLSAARKRTGEMIKAGKAARCDYVEDDRRLTAEQFVAFAFSGLADSIMTRVKHANYGKLEAEIRDAFTLIKNLGRAFRNARVTQPYLDARVDELRWAATARELKRQAQEEQRQLREQIREEQKAQREIERALKQSAAEEQKLKSQLEAAQRRAQAATTQAERDRLALQLAELQIKLAEAEARNQRALSMAQQTREGHIYVISNVGSLGEGVLKIGCTRRLDPMDRVWELADASLPFDYDVHAMISTDDAPELERPMHKAFALNQVNQCNPRNEFFRVAIADVRKALDERGVAASWSMESESREYKETLAIEAKLAADPEMKKRWVAGQRDIEIEPVRDVRELEESAAE